MTDFIHQTDSARLDDGGNAFSYFFGIRKHTDKPFGVNLTPKSTRMDEQLEVMLEEQVPVFSYGRGSPAHLIERAKSTGLIALPTMGAVEHAVRAEQDGADAVIVQGVEAGGACQSCGYHGVGAAGCRSG